MKKLIILISIFISNNILSQIQYDGTNLRDVVLQQAAATRKADSIRITKNILTNTKMIDSLNQLIVDEINKIRKQHNLPVIQRIKSKDAACQIYAKQLLDDNAIGHYSNDLDAIWEICYAATNTELMFSNLLSVAHRQVTEWMNSPNHKAVILGKNFNTHFSSISIGQQFKLINSVSIIPVISNRTVVRFF